MPPPSLPRKANPSAMPSRRAFRSPPSRSSDDWVPSSQPHETSIPRPERANDTEASGSVPCTPVDQSSQIVPSSQSNERELRIPEGQPTISDIPRVPAAALSHDSFFPLSMTDSEDRHSPSQDGFTGEFPSPTFVESSQSQYEHDLTASHAEMIDARRTALLWGKEAEPASIPSSSPPRPVESQDYYANDEYSQSQDTCSQPSTFGSSQPPASSSRISSQSGTYDEMSYPQTPSQLRHFTDMFLNRDEFGNELPQSGAEGGGSTTRPRSVSPSPTSRKKPRLEDPRGESSLTFSPQQRISPSPSHAHPGHGLRVHHRERSSGHGDDMLGELSTSHPTSQSFMDELEDDSSSQELPSAMQDFLAMFDGSQPSQVAHL
ncbi:hypothetical protein C8Q78DRAFT_59323 [Trametes maxima]|nr:hypothetical protein C8Q78DRAFT_59323 [Trametes maxima]